MGSFFSPKVPSYTPFTYKSSTQQTASRKLVGDLNDQPSTPTKSEDGVRDVIRRSTRGRSSLIQTSYRGVLGEANAPFTPQRKNLLGE